MPNKVGYEQICQTNNRGVNNNNRTLNTITPKSVFDPRCVNNSSNNNSSNNNSKNNNSKN